MTEKRDSSDWALFTTTWSDLTTLTYIFHLPDHKTRRAGALTTWHMWRASSTHSWFTFFSVSLPWLSKIQPTHPKKCPYAGRAVCSVSLHQPLLHNISFMNSESFIAIIQSPSKVPLSSEPRLRHPRLPPTTSHLKINLPPPHTPPHTACTEWIYLILPHCVCAPPGGRAGN